MSVSFKLGLPLLACALASAQIPEDWLAKPILPEQMRRSEMYAFVNQNIPALPKFTTLDEWQRYRAKVRRELLKLIGIDDILATHKFKVIPRGTLQREGYKIDKILYESYPGMLVPALVYIPDRVTGKAPAAVSITGHSYCDSKAADYIQARNYNLVKRGFIVISYDYFGCFERGRLDACQPGNWGGEDHTNSLFSYTNRTHTGIEVLDGIRAIDYLYSRPDVDRARIAFTGESGGGNNTYWVSALDERVTLSVPVSSAGAFSQWIQADDNYDWHQRPPGLRAVAEIATLFALVAPRPLLVMNGHNELNEFALPDAQRAVTYARDIYRLYGAQDKIAFVRADTNHGYQEDKRLRLYRWLARFWFNGNLPQGTADLPAPVEPRDTLRVGLENNKLTIPELSRRWIKETQRTVPIPATAAAAQQWQVTQRAALEPLLNRVDLLKVPGVATRQVDHLEKDGIQAERLTFHLTPDLWIPAIWMRPLGARRIPAVIVLNKSLANSPEVRDLLKRGRAVLALDPRGTGEMDWGGGRTSNWANFMGRPPVGMWAEDVSRVTSYLLSRRDVANVFVLGYGLFGKVALYAAALDPRITQAAVTLDSLSYRHEADSGLNHVYADVPHILAWGDTAQLAALVAPRRLAIFSAGIPESSNDEKRTYFSPLPRFQATGQGASEPDLQSTYQWTRDFYKSLNADSALTLGISSAPLPTAVADWLAPAN